ncbi:hypothetical protein pb186bvf_007500 [Paramecium bursaria]
MDILELVNKNNVIEPVKQYDQDQVDGLKLILRVCQKKCISFDKKTLSHSEKQCYFNFYQYLILMNDHMKIFQPRNASLALNQIKIYPIHQSKKRCPAKFRCHTLNISPRLLSIEKIYTEQKEICQYPLHSLMWINQKYHEYTERYLKKLQRTNMRKFTDSSYSKREKKMIVQEIKIFNPTKRKLPNIQPGKFIIETFLQ